MYGSDDECVQKGSEESIHHPSELDRLAAWSIYPQVTNGHLAGESTRNLNPRQMLGFWRLALRHNADHIPACLQYGQSQHPHLCVISTTEN
ncbi:hypothetical protein Pdw03_2322 [Penicillium digitatum]|uniref:Uncharacterized protein n=1 Tax=Penicillium digitatum TaxID=36651 RepID=A0A7T6XE57_PENDI|nr:hypothetical protein Pdw03_2322 [Penicillium digitatum]